MGEYVAIVYMAMQVNVITSSRISTENKHLLAPEIGDRSISCIEIVDLVLFDIPEYF